MVEKKNNKEKRAKKYIFTNDEIAEALEQNYGLITRTAKYLGMSYEAVKERIAYNKEYFEPILDRIRNTLLDDAEIALTVKALRDRETSALIFFLKTKGRDRGWAEKTIMEFKEFPKIQIVPYSSDKKEKKENEDA